LRVPGNVVSMPGKKALEKLLYAYLYFRQADNGVCWPHQRTIAADLGCSLPTAQKALRDFEKDHILQAKHAHGGLKQGNQYRVTNKLLLVAKVSPRSESRTKKCITKDKISKELKRTGFANQIFSDCLSKAGAQDESRRLLIQYGVNSKVADSLVNDNHHPFASVKNAVQNAIAREYWLSRTDPFRASQFKLAGYVVACLNTARDEAHTVEPSKRSQAIKRIVEEKKLWTPKSEEYYRREKRRQLVALRVLTG